ncbi:MAG: ABC transporter permease [Nanoarchaeota archaeon]|nr:ABC transporter permease [Nanoarchaeota archaeon]MBU1632443.1 ABC transporter permease [Nanoarchaeota archaeon]
MKTSKCLKHALNMVLHSRLRSWLTIIGIVIGVAAVIAIVSIGAGMQQSMEEQMGGLGGDILTLSAGFSRGGSMFGSPGGREGSSSSTATEEEIVLDRTDLQALKGISDIALIDTQIRGNVEVSFLGKSGSVSLTGVDQKVWSDITTEEIKDGRMLGPADQNVIVIGSRLASSYFNQPVGINKMITIEDSAFRVVGILESESNSIYMPIQMAYQVLEDKENGVYDSIIIKVKNEELLDETIAKIENKLMITRHVTAKNKDFSISSSKQMQETRSEMMSSLNAFLLAIAAISLIVGAIGVANTMFTSVLEKTKEIGIMKAIGARNKDILMIFLLNAGLIGLVGGILGIFLGIILSGSMSVLFTDMRMIGSTLVTFNSVIMALSVSVGVGILAGFIPARKASKLKPVDALRYE